MNSKKVLRFGKHKGRPINELDDRHLQQIPRIYPESTWWGKAAAEVLKARGAVKQQVEADSVQPLLADLKTCSVRRDLNWGKGIHAKAVESGNGSHVHIATALINMYAKCGSMAEARQVFESISRPDVVSWNALLLGYADNGEGNVALDLFSRMKAHGCAPDFLTYVAAIKGCASLAVRADGDGRADCLEQGRRIHSEIGCHVNAKVQSALIDMYAKCGSTADAHGVFESIRRPDVVSWSALILGYAENGEGAVALELFSRMKAHGCTPNFVTYIAALKACTCVAGKQDGAGRTHWLEWGRRIHSEIGCRLNLYVQSSLVDMYAKCGSMAEAHKVFDSISHPDVALWNALLLGYADNGDGVVALDLFSRMKSYGCAPNSRTYMGVLKACGFLGALEYGRQVHSEISRFDAYIVSGLVDFYAKCAAMVDAREVFDLHRKRRNISSWNALLAGYSNLGDTGSVFGLFESMQDAAFKPDDVTFVCILQCCNHAGSVGKAREYFDAMPAKYGVTRTVKHYTCMVDVLGRANKLDDAVAVLHRMPCDPDVVIWTSVLDSCRKWRNVGIGRLAFQCLVSLNEKDAVPYVLMAHIYGSKGMWEEQEKVLGMGRTSQAWKVPGQASWTNKLGRVVSFVVGDIDYPQVQEKLEWLFGIMKEHGHAAESKKEEALCGHCERHAVVYAILNTEPGETVRVVKNLRVCDDCHRTIAFISMLERRTIVVRDASRFHVFVDGQCSCGS